MEYDPTAAQDEQQEDRIAKAVVGATIEVHRILGPGFLESIKRIVR
jgi:hypothetical protein